MLIKGSKWDAADALLKTLLKSTDKYCNNCGQELNYEMKLLIANGHWCCEEPDIGTHAYHLRRVIEQNKELTKENINAYGATEKKQMRACLSLPPTLWKDWLSAFKSSYGEDLISSQPQQAKKDVRQLMRKFPALRRCETV